LTAPTITYGHGFLDDYWNTLSNYTLTTGGGSTVTATQDSNKNLDLNCTVYGADSYFTNNTNLGLATLIYTTVLYAVKTTGSAKAKIIATFSDASTQTILAATSFTSWTVGSATLTSAKILDHLSFYQTTATGHVYYDFALVCKGIFTFPQYTKLTWSMKNRYNNTQAPSRLGRRKAWMGADETVVMIDGDVDANRATWKRSLYYIAADVFNDIHHNASSEPWQFFKSDRGQFKAVVEELTFTEAPDNHYLAVFAMTISEYSASNLNMYTLQERIGLAQL
jgi:hypothetical protein